MDTIPEEGGGLCCNVYDQIRARWREVVFLQWLDRRNAIQAMDSENSSEPPQRCGGGCVVS